MAQPKNRQRREHDPAKAANRAELENLQKKADGIVQKRNEFNSQAHAARDERDLLHEKRKSVLAEMNKAKAERDAFNVKLREVKDLRGQYQAQAKELIAKKRARFKKEAPPASRSVGLRVRELMAEIKDLEFGQQTRVLTTAQENELLKQLRMKQHEYVQLRREVEKAAKVEVDLSDTDAAIDALFAKADEQHQLVLALYKSSAEAHERFVKILNEVATISAEATKHHKQFIEMRTKADEQHQQFLELRDKMLELKGKDFADRQEERAVLREQQHKVRQAVADPRRLDQAAEGALEALKKGGKIRLGG